MDIPLGVNVYCADGMCGRSVYVIVDPLTEEVTHIVVSEQAFPHLERTVPIDLVAESTPTELHLACTTSKLATLDPFVETEYVDGDISGFAYMPEDFWMWPYVAPQEDEAIPVEHERIPPGELAVRRGTRVDATDGHIGQVDEFLVDPGSHHISHLVLREGHLWGQRDVTIPVADIDSLEESTVHLKLSRREVETLPAIPIRRRKG